MTTRTVPSDPKPRLVEAAGVKPRKAIAEGGSGLMPVTPTQAQGLDHDRAPKIDATSSDHGLDMPPERPGQR